MFYEVSTAISSFLNENRRERANKGFKEGHFELNNSMGFYEHWGPFIHLSNFMGLFPYRIKSNGGKCTQFVFSWCHPITLWCVLALIFQLIPIVGIAIYFSDLEKVRSTEQTHVPKSITILSSLGPAFHYSIIFVSRGIAYRHNRLSAAVDSVTNQIIKDLEGKFETYPNCRNLTKKRSLFGFIMILASVYRPTLWKISTFHKDLTVLFFRQLLI